MPQIKFSELPEDLKVQLSEEGKEELWHRIDEFGGIKEFSENFEFSQSKMYNWKNKELALPVKFVQRVLGENRTEEITLLKSEGSSNGIKNPEFPLQISNELLTRVEESVTKNTEDTPVYLTDEKSLISRFTELLNEMGEVDFSVYSRSSRYEIRYPKFLNKIFSELDYKLDTAALVDESGEITEDKVLFEDKEIPLENFEEELHSKEKKFNLALRKGKSSKITKLIAEEAQKIEKNLLK